MLVENLKFIMQLKGLSQSDLARAAGVSRQAVSLWMNQKDSEIVVKSSNMLALAKNLGIDIHELIEPLPDTRGYQVALLWDNLYGSLPELLLAAVQGEPRALARLVQVYGLLVTKKLFGKKALSTFQTFKKYLHPVRQKESEQIWKILTNQI